MTIKPTRIRNLQDREHVVITEGTILIRSGLPNDEEIWHNIGDSGAPVFENGWSNYGSGTAPVGFRKDASGFVHLRGVAKGVPASGIGGYSVIFTLPASWRPGSMEVFRSRRSGLSPGELVPIYVRPNGQVCLYWAVAGDFVMDYLYLDNYRWRAL